MSGQTITPAAALRRMDEVAVGHAIRRLDLDVGFIDRLRIGRARQHHGHAGAERDRGELAARHGGKRV